jgi:hypothetical protein
VILSLDLETRRNSDSRSSRKDPPKFQHFPETRALSLFINSEEPGIPAGKFASDSVAGALADESLINDGVECQHE